MPEYPTDHDLRSCMSQLEELIVGHNLRVIVGQLRKKQLDDITEDYCILPECVPPKWYRDMKNEGGE